MKEQSVQNDIRVALAGKAYIFRINTGSGWTGEQHRMRDGSLVLRNPRPFSTGTPKGYADLTGFRVIEITPDMVGQKIAQFVAIEVKTTKGRASDEQSKFIDVVNKNGGCGGICRSREDAVKLVEGK